MVLGKLVVEETALIITLYLTKKIVKKIPSTFNFFNLTLYLRLVAVFVIFSL
jgi:hypothetical protein